jgi:predicted porin
MLLAAGLCVAAAARAQDADPVTLYGRVFSLLESVEVRGGATPAIRRNRVTDQASLLGVRGTEDLGGGLSAWFQLETGFAVDSPGSFAARDSGVGLLGPWGTFLVGRWDSAFTACQAGMVDPFFHLGLPDIAGAALHQGNFARRERNVVQYWSPRVGGLRTKMNYAANEGRTASVNPYDYAVNFSFQDSATYAAVAFEKHNDQVASTPTAGSAEQGLGVSGIQQFGPFRIFGQYGRYRRTGTTTQRSYMIAFDFKHGAHELLGTYQNSRDGDVTASAAQPRCTLIGAGYRYRFSPRTFFMAQYARVDNKVGALCNFGTNPVAISAGQGLRAFAVGLRTSI